MTPAEGGTVRVSVVYLTPRLAFRRVLSLPSPATVGEAIEASGVRREVPELAASEPAVGVFGQSRSLADALHDGDRVEVYRPLTIDPKQARRVRVAVRRRRKTAAGAGRD